ncbi:MAG: hypothetical protein L6V86_00630 [Treponema sp.]|nr:MAG: hypothetical protein L6V86_00630 [Treponema sp.]
MKFNGLNFSGTEDNPVRAMINGADRPIVLKTWKKVSPLSCELSFSNGIALSFSVSDDTAKAYLSVEGTLPPEVSRVFVPYNFAVGTSVLLRTDSQIQVETKKNSWELNAPSIHRDYVVLAKTEKVASYSYFNRTHSFTFEDTVAFDGASEATYRNNVENLKQNLINSFAQIPSDSQTVAEQEAVSFVAAMAEKGRYNEALDSVPQNFKRNALRTFLSAPYFDTLARVNEPLQAQLKNYGEMIARAAESSGLDIFNVRFIADYMCMHPGAGSVKKLLAAAAAAEISEKPLQQAIGILAVYNDLCDKNQELANILAPAAAKSVEKISSSCAVDENLITISENGIFLSVVQAVQAGDAILRYGETVKDSSLVAGGRLIVSSHLKESSSFDLKTLGELYPIVVHDNYFYPHFEILAFNNGKAVWAWTCAKNISYENDSQGSIVLNVDFPLSYTHYAIITGIERFQTIYIYDLAFRTDARFETYNSSGYVYQNDSNSLLLKSRHKNQIEQIRLVYPHAGEMAAKPEETQDSE